MSESTETNPQPTTNSPAEVDWSTPEPDEVRLPPPAADPEDQPNDDNAVVEGADEPAKASAPEDDDPIGDDPDESGTDDDGPPEFWSAEKKALWAKVQDPEVKAAIKDHVREVTTGVAKKLEENARKVQAAEEASKQAIAAQQEQVQWWNQNGPMLAAVIQGEFAGVNLDQLAQDNPAEWARVKQSMEARQNWLRGIGAHIQGQQQQVEKARKTQEEAARVAEHGKLAAKFPKEFGTAEAAKRTYDVLGNYLHKAGIAPERINQVYEAPIVELVRKAYKYDQLQAKTSGITNPKPPAQSASTTPTRVVPGARSSANPVNEATRQAVERLKSGERLSPDEAALAFR